MSSYGNDEGREVKEGTAISEKIEEKDTTKIEDLEEGEVGDQRRNELKK